MVTANGIKRPSLVERAHELGGAAHKCGQGLESNPYPRGPAYFAWRSAWHEAELARMGAPAGPFGKSRPGAK